MIVLNQDQTSRSIRITQLHIWLSPYSSTYFIPIRRGSPWAASRAEGHLVVAVAVARTDLPAVVGKEREASGHP
jgi:hypothetical protein